MDIHNLSLNQIVEINGVTIMRVPGGWLYNSTFVKYNKEFYGITKENKIDPKMVINVTRDYFRLPRNFLLVKSKKDKRPIAKKIIVKILKDELGLIQDEIAKILKYKDRSQISYSLKTLNKKLKYDKEVINAYKYVIDKLDI